MRLIDADKVLKKVGIFMNGDCESCSIHKNAMKMGFLECEDIGYTLRDICDLMTSMPLENKVGHWIAADITFTNFTCSCCNTNNIKTRWSYCPNCGAKMDNKIVGLNA